MAFWKKKPKEKELSEPPHFHEMGEIKRAIKPVDVFPVPPRQEVPEEVEKLAPPVTIPPITVPPVIVSPAAVHPAANPSMETGKPLVKDLDEKPSLGAAVHLKEPIFVKIDKFEEALTDFEEIKKRLQESFDLLEKIRKIRGKEEEEIAAWSKEIEELKEKLNSLDKKLFSRIEF